MTVGEPTFVPGDDRYLWIERYWRGPTWLFTTWFILRGLLRLGYEAEAAHLTARPIALIRQSGFREYFNPDVYRDAGLGDPLDVREAALAHPETVAHRRAISARCLRSLREAGIAIEDPTL